MEQILHYKTAVKIWEADNIGKAKLSSLFNYFQHAAQLHAKNLGVGHKDLIQQNQTWVLTAIKITIHNVPLWEQLLVIETWPKGNKSLFYLRDFFIKDPSGNTLISGTSEWLVLDTNAKHPLRPDKTKDFSVNKDMHATTPILVREKPPQQQEVCEKIHVQWSDLDVNNHVNNSRYVDWVSDCLQNNGLSLDEIYEFQIHFISEAKKGDTISLSQSMKQAIFVDGIKDGNHIFQARISLKTK